MSLLCKDNNRIHQPHARLGSPHFGTYGQHTLRAGIAACILLAGPGKQVGSPGELGSESMIKYPKTEERTYGLLFGSRPDAAWEISAPRHPPDNMLGDMPLCKLEFLDPVTGVPNCLLNWDLLHTRTYS